MSQVFFIRSTFTLLINLTNSVFNLFTKFQLTTNPSMFCSFFFVYFKGERDSGEGIKRSGSQMSGDSVRRCSRPISRFNGAVSNRRSIARHELLVHGRLCWSWLLLCGNSDTPRRSQGPIPWTHHHPSRQPRVPPDHTSVRILWRVSAQIRKSQCLEVLHRSVRLSTAHRSRWRSNILLARRTVAVDWHTRSY